MAKEEEIPLEQAWKNWIACLIGDDRNSIYPQIYSMVWDTAIYRVVFEGRKKQIEKNPNKPEINQVFHSFLDRNYFQAKSVTIRRLIDTSYGITGNKGIYSLGALIKDLRDYRQELSRKKYLDLRNMPYDYQEIRKKELEYCRKQPYGKGFRILPELDWERIEETHQTFDRLSGNSPTTRQADDVIGEQIFIRLQGKLDTCNKFKMYVDKFVAHSATPESRQIEDVDKTAITLKHLWDAQKTLFEVAEFISLLVLYESHMPLALEKPSFYDYWDKPLFSENEAEFVNEIMNNLREETEKWEAGAIKNTWDWIDTI